MSFLLTDFKFLCSDWVPPAFEIFNDVSMSESSNFHTDIVAHIKHCQLDITSICLDRVTKVHLINEKGSNSASCCAKVRQKHVRKIHSTGKEIKISGTEQWYQAHLLALDEIYQMVHVLSFNASKPKLSRSSSFMQHIQNQVFCHKTFKNLW